MADVTIIRVDRTNLAAVIDFSDGTTASFTAEELCKLKPIREVIEHRDLSTDIIVRRPDSN